MLYSCGILVLWHLVYVACGSVVSWFCEQLHFPSFTFPGLAAWGSSSLSTSSQQSIIVWGLSGCHDGGGNRITKTSLITHLRDRHCNSDAQAITKHALLTDLVVFERAELGLVDGLVHDQHGGFTLSLLDSLFSKELRTVRSIPPKCRLGFSRVLKGALDKEESITNAIRSWGVSGGSLQLVRETLAESTSHMLGVDDEVLDLSERNLKQCRRKICDGHYTAAVRVLSSSGVAPYNDGRL
nr:putative reverse transcriptase domain-containing protein [Tanacetum cinerariifolium]